MTAIDPSGALYDALYVEGVRLEEMAQRVPIGSDLQNELIHLRTIVGAMKLFVAGARGPGVLRSMRGE